MYKRYDYYYADAMWLEAFDYLCDLSPRIVALRHGEDVTARYIPEEHANDESWQKIYDPMRRETWNDVLDYWESKEGV